MSVKLALMVVQLEQDVPVRGSIPSAEQYERAIKTAVVDYSGRRPLRKKTTLSVVSGMAAYSLPDDFREVILLESITSPDGVLVSSTGLIPVSAVYEERFYVVGTTMTFDPTPTYTLDRDLWYLANYVLDADGEYADMTEAVANLVLLKAAAVAKTMQANGITSGDVVEYQMGDVRVKRADLVKNLHAAAQSLERQYVEAVEASVGAVGQRATYNWLGR